MTDFYDDLLKRFPDFRTTRCEAIRDLRLWNDVEGKCCRLVLTYAGDGDISLIVKGIREYTLREDQVLPFDLGEFMIARGPDNRIVLHDELKGWRIVGDALEFDSIAP